MLHRLRSAIRTLVHRALRRDARYYQRAYRRANLEADYWSVVGPASAEQFASLGHGKRRLLVGLGLTPTSRVLDVGCGTGLLTAALVEYLDPGAVYVGTDIAPEAIAFCRTRFDRPNFRFLESAMTHVPLTAERFDVVFFGSVLTHIYPREITALLADVGRLLDRGGQVVADAFVAPAIGSHRGNRGLVVVDDAVLVRCFGAAGYRHTEIHRYPWQAGVERAVFQLRRATDAIEPPGGNECPTAAPQTV